MNFKTTAAGVLILLMAITAHSCKHEPWVPDNYSPTPEDTVTISSSCNPDSVYFQNDVLPIFASSCAMSGCHDEVTAEDGVILTDYFRVMSTGDIDPGNPNDSKVYEVLIETGDDLMPPPGSGITLSPEQRNAIYTWILQGAQNNACEDATCDSTGISYSNDVRPIFELHCLGCHTGSAAAGGGIPFDTYAQVSTYASNGKLIGSITHQAGFSPMPKGTAKLSDCKIAVIRNWIAEGIQDN